MKATLGAGAKMDCFFTINSSIKIGGGANIKLTEKPVEPFDEKARLYRDALFSSQSRTAEDRRRLRLAYAKILAGENTSNVDLTPEEFSEMSIINQGPSNL